MDVNCLSSVLLDNNFGCQLFVSSEYQTETWNLHPSPKTADQINVQTVEPSREMYVLTYLGQDDTDDNEIDDEDESELMMEYKRYQI